MVELARSSGSLPLRAGCWVCQARNAFISNVFRQQCRVQPYCNQWTVTVIQQQARLLRRALEMTERGVILLGRDGRVGLISSRARGWLTEYCGRPGRVSSRLPEPLRSAIEHEDAYLRSTDGVPHSKEPLRIQRDRTCLMVLHLCDANQCLLLLEEQQAIPETSPFESFDLTKREVEVFHWVVRGKTNTEIAVILAVSPRTVQKHLEHVFKKLGVETRGAATLALNWRLGT